MRIRRLSFVAGWTAVIMAAVIGFSAFGTSGEGDPEISVEAAASTIGHTAGAYAGVSFAMMSGDSGGAIVVAGDDTEEPAESAAPAGENESPTSTSIPIEVDASGWLSEIQVRALVTLYFDRADVNRAVRIAWCESRFDPGSVNLRTGGVGLFQHLPRYWAERSSEAGFGGYPATDPEASTAAAAWEVYNGAGWEIFSCRG